MASAAVEELVETYLAANWTRAPIFSENKEGETPADGSEFIVLQFPLSDVRRSFVNQRNYREEGGFRIVINVARGEGTATIRQYGAELAALFRDTKIGAITCGVPSEPFTDDQSDQGNYFTGALVVPYTYDFAG